MENPEKSITALGCFGDCAAYVHATIRACDGGYIVATGEEGPGHDGGRLNYAHVRVFGSIETALDFLRRWFVELDAEVADDDAELPPDLPPGEEKVRAKP